MPNLKITHDPKTDRAYIYLRNGVTKPEESRICAEVGEPVEIIVDFDRSGRLLGIEVLNASRLMPPRLLEQAEPTD